MSYINIQTATTANVASSAANVTLFPAKGSVRGRSVYNESTSVLLLKFGATASAASYTVKIASEAYYDFPKPLYGGQVDGIWVAANGFARTTEW